MSKIDEGFVVGEFGFIDAHIERFRVQFIRISKKVEGQCPSFLRFQSEATKKAMEFEQDILASDFTELIDHPVTQLCAYANSLYNIYWQILYSIERLNVLATWITPPRGVGVFGMNYCISFYFSSVLTKVKSITDVLGLMTNHIFELGVENKRCGLDKGVVANRLMDKYGSTASGGDDHIKHLARVLEQERNNWIQDFDELRDIVIHRDEIQSMAFSIPKFDPNLPEQPFVIEHPFLVVASPHNPMPLELIQKIAPTSIFFDNNIDPLIFCAEVQRKLATLIESVSDGCYPQIDAFISKHSA